LEIDQDLEFHHRLWIVQRVGWVIVGLLLIAALAGVFGSGPVSSSSVGNSAVRLEYQRFGRLQQPTTIRFHFSSEAGDVAKLFFNRKYLESFVIEHITPPPDEVEPASQWLIYSFKRREPTSVTFHLRPDEFGLFSGEARLAEGEPISFRQFIYP
jgi:hypothetical protein